MVHRRVVRRQDEIVNRRDTPPGAGQTFAVAIVSSLDTVSYSLSAHARTTTDVRAWHWLTFG